MRHRRGAGSMHGVRRMTEAMKTVRCGSCGHENPPEAEICAACGASLAAYRSISAAVPEARQPAAPPPEPVPEPASLPEPAPPSEPAEETARPASPIGEALARIRERTAGERAEQPSVVAAVEAEADASSVTFAPPAEPPATSAVDVPATSPPEAEANRGASPPVRVDQPQAPAVQPRLRPTSDQEPRRERTAAQTRAEPKRTAPKPVRTPPRRQGPDRLARASAASLITWGIGLVAFAFVLGIALPNARHQALGEAVVTIATLVGIVLFVVGLARKSGARRPGDRRPPRRR